MQSTKNTDIYCIIHTNQNNNFLQLGVNKTVQSIRVLLNEIVNLPYQKWSNGLLYLLFSAIHSSLMIILSDTYFPFFLSLFYVWILLLVLLPTKYKNPLATIHFCLMEYSQDRGRKVTILYRLNPRPVSTYITYYVYYYIM